MAVDDGAPTPQRASGDRAARAAGRVLVLLAVAIAIGVLCFGAPSRFGSAADAPGAVRIFFEALGPLALIEAAVAIGAGWLLAAGAGARWRRAPRGWRVASALLLGLLLLAIAQHVPLPRGLLRIGAPYSALTWDRLTDADDTSWRPLSLWPGGGFHALYTLLGVVVATSAAWLAAARRPRAARRVLLFVAACATLVSAYGLWSTHFGDDTVLGFEKLSSRTRVTGTFIAAPTLGVWAGMGACAALALGVAAAQRRRALPALLLWGAGAVCAVACVLSLSRTMTAALGAGIAVLLALLAGVAGAAGRRGLRATLVSLVLAIPAVGIALAASIPSLRERVMFLESYYTGQLAPGELRFAGWRATWHLFLETPLFGTGLGSFGRAIHLTQSVDSPQELWYAHCDPLNLLSDTGIVGFVLGVGWLAVAAWLTWRASRSGPLVRRTVAAGCLAAATVVVIGSLGDFQTQFAVVALPFGALLGAGAALGAGSTPESASGSTSGATRGSGATAAPARAGLTTPVLGLVLGAALAAPPLLYFVRRAGDISDGWPPGATRAERLVAVARAGIGPELLRSAEDPLEEITAAHGLFRDARTEDPLLDEAHYWEARVGSVLRRPDDEVLRALGRARWVSRGHANVNLLVGQLYRDILGPEPAPFGPPGDSAVAALREAGALSPHAFGEAFAVGLRHGFTAPEMLRLCPTPERDYAAVALGKWLRRQDAPEQALDVYRDRMRHEPRDGGVGRLLAHLYRRLGREEEGRAFFAEIGAAWPL